MHRADLCEFYFFFGGGAVGCSERPKKSLGKPYKHVGAGGLLRSTTMMDLIPKP